MAELSNVAWIGTELRLGVHFVKLISSYTLNTLIIYTQIIVSLS